MTPFDHILAPLPDDADRRFKEILADLPIEHRARFSEIYDAMIDIRRDIKTTGSEREINASMARAIGRRDHFFATGETRSHFGTLRDA